MIDEVLSISALIGYINSKLYSDSRLRNIRVSGELGNFSSYRGSGHWYFTLKDAGAQIRGAMFRGHNSAVSFMPKDGDSVIVTGNINIYENRGELQLVVSEMQLAGLGNFYIQFERTKAKLEPLGYFDLKRKKEIKMYPEQISVVTGANTAALQDIRITIARRWPAVTVREVYAVVQGKEAITSVVNALRIADAQGSDTIILARGGGSVDDLWCFNDEEIARAIFECRTPVITGIGHESDITIADLVADVRAATPTAAAQRATPSQDEVRKQIAGNLDLMRGAVERKLQKEMQSFDIYSARLEHYFAQSQTVIARLSGLKNILYLSLSKNIDTQLERKRHHLLLMETFLRQKLKNAVGDLTSGRQRFRDNYANYLKSLENKFTGLAVSLDNLSPLKTMARGYIISSQNGLIIKSVDQIDVNKEINLRYADGEVSTKVMRKEKWQKN